MCGRGATSACAASGRTNVVTRIAATCPSLLPHRVGGARLRQCSCSLPKCSSPSRSRRTAARQRTRRFGGVRGDSGDGWARGFGGSVMLACAPAAARSRSCPDGSGRRARGTVGRYYGRMKVSRCLGGRGLGVPRGGRRLSRRAVWARVRGCRRGRRRVVVGGARVRRAARRRRRFAGAGAARAALIQVVTGCAGGA